MIFLWFPNGTLGPLGPFRKSLRSGPLGPLGILKNSLRSGIHAQNPPKWSATPFISCPEVSPKWAASPPFLGGAGYEINGVADHFGGFWAWIPERSDFFKGPKGPKGPLGPERSDFFKRPKGPKGPLGPYLGILGADASSPKWSPTEGGRFVRHAPPLGFLVDFH